MSVEFEELLKARENPSEEAQSKSVWQDSCLAFFFSNELCAEDFILGFS